MNIFKYNNIFKKRERKLSIISMKVFKNDLS